MYIGQEAFILYNEVIQQMLDRKSVRAFTDQEITQEAKLQILEAAVNAPTAGNQQLYTILDITDQEIKNRLVDSCDHQPFIAKAKLVLIFCADCKKWYEAFEAMGCEPRKPAVGDLFLAAEDTAIAAQNAVSAAWSLGIGSCYIGDIFENAEVHQEMLGLPKYVMPVSMLVFGYPTQQQMDREKPARVELKHIVHENRYRELPAEELHEMLDYKKGQMSYEQWIKAYCDRKYNSDFSKEMSRSVGVYLKEYES